MAESPATSCNSISTVEIKNNVISGNRIKNENLDSYGTRYLAKGDNVWISTAMEPGGTALIELTDNEVRDNGPADGPTFGTGGGVFATHARRRFRQRRPSSSRATPSVRTTESQ